MATHRNAPCPCGSGRKYKHCCGRPSTAGFPAPALVLQDEQQQAQKALMSFAAQEHGIEGVTAIWEEFVDTFGLETAQDADPIDAAFRGPDGPLFSAWYLTIWTSEDTPVELPLTWPSADTLAAEFLARGPRRTTPAVRRLVDAWRRSPFTFWEVTEVEPGVGARLRDYLLDREIMVYDRSLSGVVNRWDNLFAQVVGIDGVHIVAGSGSMVIPPRLTPEIRENLEGIRSNVEAEEPESLLEYDLDLLMLYFDIQRELEQPFMPLLRNTEGEELVITTSTYAVAADRRDEVIEALLSIPDLQARGEDEPSPTSFDWVLETPDGPMATTLRGHLHLEDAALQTSCNSRERDAALRQMVEDVLGDLIHHESTVAEAMDWDTIQAQEDDSAARRAPPPPELKELERKVMGTMILRWAEDSVPALGGQAPRAAVRTAAGRREVADLINGWENSLDRAGNDYTAEFNALRRSLGLPEA